MDSSNLFGILLGIIAALSMNIGKGVQKMRVDVLKKGKAALKKENRADLLIWLIGVAMTGIAGPIYSFAMKFSDNPSVIAALGGVGLVGLLIFSKLVLNEVITTKKLTGAILVIIGTVIISLMGSDEPNEQIINYANFKNVGIIYLAVFSALFMAGFKWENSRATCFSISSGICLGSAMVLADIALAVSGGDMTSQFKAPYVYFAIITGNVAFVFTQFSLLRGEASSIIPTMHSMVIATSVGLQYLIFSSKPTFFQMFGLTMIIVGVVFLASKVIEDLYTIETNEVINT